MGRCQGCQTGTSCSNERLCPVCAKSLNECEICREKLPLPWPLEDVPANEMERQALITEIDLLSAQPIRDDVRIEALIALLERYQAPTPGT